MREGIIFFLVPTPYSLFPIPVPFGLLTADAHGEAYSPLRWINGQSKVKPSTAIGGRIHPNLAVMRSNDALA